MARQPNIVWITVDSVRQDHTSLSDYERDTTPNLSRISDGEGGASFPLCMSHANFTRSSTASIITGTYVTNHQVWGNRIIPAELDTIPGRLADAGYHTACISRNVNSSMGFDREFDRFNWISASNILGSVRPTTLARYLLNIRKHSAGFTTDTAKHATPFLVNETAKDWMSSFEDEGAEPFFMYLHYNEPHRPYHPPLPYLDTFDDFEMSTDEAVELSMDVHYNMEEWIAEGCDFTDDEWRALKAMYDAEIRYTDECIGDLIDFIQRTFDDTIVVVTSDHGELFGEKGVLGHKILLHDAVINVPLITHGLPGVEGRDDQLVQHADVMVALLEEAGAETDGVQGLDFRDEDREFTVSQEVENSLDEYIEHNPDFDESRYHEPLLTCIRTDEFKYQKSADGSDLYELPDETTDVSDRYPEIAAELDDALKRWREEEGRPLGESREAEFSADMEKQLEDLGYM